MSSFRRISLFVYKLKRRIIAWESIRDCEYSINYCCSYPTHYPNSRIWILRPKQSQGFKPSTANLTQILFQYPRPRCFDNHYYHISWLKVFYDTVIAFFVFPYLVLFSFVILHPLSCISSSCLHISGLQQAFLHIYHHRIVGEDHYTSGISFDSPYHRLHCRRSTDPIFPNYRSRELEPKY